MPNSQDEWTIHALNIHGVFFERRCKLAVDELSDWCVLATNYPVEFPAPNGPWRGKESSLDIWARREERDGVVTDVFIECKKANPDFVNWVFFPEGARDGRSPFRFGLGKNGADEANTSEWTRSFAVANGNTDLLLASDAREVRGDYSSSPNAGKTKTSNAAIQDAAYQVALGCQSIVKDDSALLDRARTSPLHPLPPWREKRYVPIIATTARLFSVDFAPNDVGLTSGEIPLSRAKLTPLKSLVLEYPLPRHLQFAPANPLQVLSSGDLSTFSRLHILVVQAESLSSLLSDLFKGAE